MGFGAKPRNFPSKRPRRRRGRLDGKFFKNKWWLTPPLYYLNQGNSNLYPIVKFKELCVTLFFSVIGLFGSG